MSTIDSAALRLKLKEFFGYDNFKGDQERIIMHLVGGNDADCMPNPPIVSAELAE